MNQNYTLTFKILFIIFLLLFSSCLSTKNWTEEQHLLKQPQIVGFKKASYDRLYYFMRPKPNRRFLGQPIWAAIYQSASKKFNPQIYNKKIDKIKEKYDKKINDARLDKKLERAKKLENKKEKKIKQQEIAQVEGNWLMRVVGEKPVFLDTALARTNAQEMQEFLNKNGFFQGKVTAEIKYLRNKRATIIYKIDEQKPTFFGITNIVTKNKHIDSVLTANLKYSELKENTMYNSEKFDAERKRIVDVLRQNGYLFFNQQFVQFKVDTLHFNFKIDTLKKLKDTTLLARTNKFKTDSLLSGRAAKNKRDAYITIIINEPEKGNHKKWEVEEVLVTILHENKIKTITNDTTFSKRTGIVYVDKNQKIKYSPRVLDQRIKILPKTIFNVKKEMDTQRLLTSMDIFKFITLREDTTGGKLKTNIFLTPLDKHQFQNEFGFNVLQGLPGPFVNFSFKNRNTFKGCEVFETNLRFTIDGQTGFLQDRQLYTNQEIGLNTSLNFPRVLLLRKLLPKKTRINIENYSPSTRISLGYNFVKRPEYTRQNLTAAITYRGQMRNSTYNFTLSELSLVNTTEIRDDFRRLLEDLQRQGVPIIQSFNRALVSSIYFIYTFNNNTGNENKPSHLIRVLAETGGNVFNFISRNSSIANDGKIFGLQYFQYWKFNTTFSYNLPLKKQSHLLAFRLNAGMANSFGGSNTLPYEKFFFAGGGSSIRAWRPRSLGPGEYSPSLNSDGTFNYIEQPGEIILEGNIEYRLPLFSFFRWAFFVDAGNIWTTKDDQNRVGAKFEPTRFLEQMAIGSGMGLRMSFPFLLLRFDFGLKVYDPARSSEQRWVIENFRFADTFTKNLVVLNLGIGYPF
ncbi:MAG: hypothetical protein EAZ85_04095 [Bacteroidetes bacterium]|nr:MAG: hypothetical protein EAZ85_04095 [Bacteroidota bacterium]TAG90039.1 MAG: hypothetical protein EAZ20_05255 [Bacteroidota bacterium]